jgi:hypothetical protein
MSDMNQLEKEPFVQKWALAVGVVVYLGFIAVYANNFNLPFSDSVGTWGQFGDFVGGAINPVVGLLTIWLLTASLKQSRQELILTRRALDDAKDSQLATEKALREQIKVSEQARDINNAVALWRYHVEYGALRKQQQDLFLVESHGYEAMEEDIEAAYEASEELREIMALETHRLINMYKADN